MSFPNIPFLTLIFCSLYFFAHSQVCKLESLDVRHQSDIDEFLATSQGCSIIKGDVYIREEFDGLVRDLSGLSQIQVIEGSLTIWDNVALTTLKGLENIDSVYQSIRIFSNYSLQNIDALSNLRYAGNGISMSSLTSLTTVDTFNHLQILSKLSLNNLPFEDLSMFSNVQTIWNLYISQLDSLENLHGLNALTQAGSIELEYNLFHNLSGLENLTRLDTLSLYQNYEITSLDGLENLQFIRGQLDFRNNPELSSISALEDLPVDSLNDITIRGNIKLSDCNIKLLCDAFSLSGPIELDIQYNGPGCESAMDLAAACNVICPTQLIFKSQEEIDSFPAQFSGCTVIEGDVIIEGSDINNLDSLYTITHINGSLQIATWALNLHGFHNLEYIGGTLQIAGNSKMTSLTGMGKLTTVHTLKVSNNSLLNDLSGLDALKSVHHMQIHDLSSANGLISLEKVTGNLELRELSLTTGNFPLLDTIHGGLYLHQLEFTELSGIENIKYVNTLRIWSTELTHLNGLSGLFQVNDTLDISYNDSLETLSGLNQLISGGSITISANDKLEDLYILNSMDTIHGDLFIQQNKNLKELDDLENLEYVKGSLYLHNNNLATFHGLERLARVDKNLLIQLEPKVKSFEGFSALTSVGGNLKINTMDSITNLAGFLELDSVGGDFTFLFNRLALSLEGLEQLTTIGGTLHLIRNWQLLSLQGIGSLKNVGGLHFDENTRLTNIDALSNLEQLHGGIHLRESILLKIWPDWSHIKVIPGDFIMDDVGFTNFVGLDSLMSVEGLLSIDGNFDNLKGLELLKHCGKGLTLNYTKIDNVDELANLEEINGPFLVFNHYGLRDLNGLQKLRLETLHAGERGFAVEIYDNSQLTDCSVAFLCEALISNEKPYLIQNNNRGCNHTFEIEASCNFPTTCIEGGITFTRQSQIDSFNINYPGCSFIKGEVNIEEMVDGDINNIDSLIHISDIAGPLFIRSNTALTDLNGFQGLEHVTGGINVYSNDELVSIEGLRNIDAEFMVNQNWLSWELRLQANDKLSDCAIEPICSLFTIPHATIIIGGNGPSCESIEAVRNTCAFPTTCSLGRVEDQQTIDEFPIRHPYCTELTGNLEIVSIPQMSYVLDLSPLQQLTKINGQIYISNNTYLTNLHGLHNLTEINGPVVIRWNELLDDISALSKIDPASVNPVYEDHITIYRNEILSDCAIESICAVLTDDMTSSDIEYNTGNCTSPEDVREACLLINTHESIAEGDILLYPNPTTGLLTVATGHHQPEDISLILVFDSLGRIVSKGTFTSEISLQGFSTGMYTIVFTKTNGHHISTRVIVAR